MVAIFERYQRNSIFVVSVPQLPLDERDGVHLSPEEGLFVCFFVCLLVCCIRVGVIYSTIRLY